MKNLFNLRELPEILRFILTGFLVTAINVASYHTLTPFIGHGYSVCWAYINSSIVAWMMARVFVFRGSAPTGIKRLIYFFLLSLFMTGSLYGLSFLLYEYFFKFFNIHYSKTLSYMISVVFMVPISFFFQKYVLFKPSPRIGRKPL